MSEQERANPPISEDAARFSPTMHDPTPAEVVLAIRFRQRAVNVIGQRSRRAVCEALGTGESGLDRLLATKEWSMALGFRVLDCLGLDPLAEIARHRVVEEVLSRPDVQKEAEDFSRFVEHRMAAPAHDNLMRLGERYQPMPQTDGGADIVKVRIGDMGKPSCVDHGAMNKVTPSPPGFWRCLQGKCRAGCMEGSWFAALEAARAAPSHQGLAAVGPEPIDGTIWGGKSQGPHV